MSVVDRHLYRELTKIQRQRYERGEINWPEYQKHYRINAKMNARAYKQEVRRHDGAGENRQIPL